MEAIARIRTSINEFDGLRNSDFDELDEDEGTLAAQIDESDAWHFSAPSGDWRDAYTFQEEQAQLNAAYTHFSVTLREEISQVLHAPLDRFTIVQVSLL